MQPCCYVKNINKTGNGFVFCFCMRFSSPEPGAGSLRRASVVSCQEFQRTTSLKLPAGANFI